MLNRNDTLFSPALFQFLRDLQANNEREWFQANRDRYEADVKGPMAAFIMAFAEPLARINRHFLADPRGNGGSMFRINRDTRFSANKDPYKSNVGAQFRHRDCSKDVHAPGFYLHLQPGECFISAGLWRPDPAALHKVREWIVAHPRQWQALGKAGIAVSGEAQKRVPAGFDPGHPLAEDLKLKDFYTHTPIQDREVCAPDFLDRFTAVCQGNAPLMAFLTKGLGLPW
jgi:uncharacterized protein (TIGR02453 family)